MPGPLKPFYTFVYRGRTRRLYYEGNVYCPKAFGSPTIFRITSKENLRVQRSSVVVMVSLSVVPLPPRLKEWNRTLLGVGASYLAVAPIGKS